MFAALEVIILALLALPSHNYFPYPIKAAAKIPLKKSFSPKQLNCFYLPPLW